MEGDVDGLDARIFAIGLGQHREDVGQRLHHQPGEIEAGDKRIDGIAKNSIIIVI
jgi:hypothetical protein